MPNERPTIAIDDVVALKETSLALLCLIDGKEHWLPKSVIHEDSEVSAEGDEGTLVVPEWFAEKEGLGC
jgi:hypothetical protein